MILFGLQLAIVATWALPSTPRTQLSLAAAVLSLVDSVVIGVLLYAEHMRSLSPSVLLGTYLGISAVLDLPQARSLFSQSVYRNTPLAGLFTATLTTKLGLLVLEEVPKRPLLVPKYKDAALESTSGPISRSLFLWLNGLFFRGFNRLIRVDDLGHLNNKFDSDLLGTQVGAEWKKCDKTKKHCLARATLSAFKVHFLAPIIPRIFLAGFSLAQPFLVNQVVNFIGKPTSSDSKDVAGGLIGATVLIYLGLAASILAKHGRVSNPTNCFE